MKIIIPIASNDPEIIKNYSVIKPLVKLGNKTMIETFVKNFNFEYEFIFLCRQKDLIETNLINVINSLKIKKKIIKINNNTSSVIETVLCAKKFIRSNEQVLICHPDNINIFFSKKDLINKFKALKNENLLFIFDENYQTNTSETRTGRVIVKKNQILEIVEKSILSKNSKTLAGIYHFYKWSEFLKYSSKTIKNQVPVNGRFFISQVYNEYIKDHKKISLYKVKKHITFGLVPYIDEYNFWYTYFKYNIKKKLKQKFNFLNLIPSCGDGLRFLEKNEDNFKPLINVDKTPMILKTIRSLPLSNKNVVIIRDDHNKKYNFKKKLKQNVKKLEVMVLKKPTLGMASTCYKYLKNYKKNNPILISSCDYAVIFNEQKLKKIIDFFNPDVLVWTFKRYPDARLSPFAYAYCEIKNGVLKKISEKKPISENPHEDHIAQGIFYFKSKNIFKKAYKMMIKNKDKINNEYYVGNSINHLIKNNYVVLPFEVDQYICLGTSKDLEVYNFWSKYFND